MSRKGVTDIDRDNERGAHAARRLQKERIGWLATVADDGTPETSPVWFLWSDQEILVYSLESLRTRNLAARSRVSLNLDGNGLGGDIVVVEGTARIDESFPSAAENPDYLAKYGPVMDDYGWTPEWFATRYSVPVRIAATRYRYW